MKKLILSAIAIAFIAGSAHAQAPKETHTLKKTSAIDRICNKLYLGLSTGANNPGGFLAADVDVPIVSHLSVGAGVGASTWGSKFYADVRYYLKPCNRGLAFGAGISHSTGFSNITESLSTSNGTQDVTLDLKPMSNIFLGAYYFWTLGHHANRIYVDAGYSIPLQTYSYTVTDNYQLTSDAQSAIKFLSPHGLMIGVGFSFGIVK